MREDTEPRPQYLGNLDYLYPERIAREEREKAAKLAEALPETGEQ